MSSEKVVHPGACIVGDELIQCALSDDSCKGMQFLSHRQLQGTKHAEKCNGGFSNHERGDHIGMCVTRQEDFLCTSHSSNCALPFVDSIPYCNLQYNYFPQRDFPFALYGRCVPAEGTEGGNIPWDGTCVWSADSCLGHTYVPATEQLLLAKEKDVNYDDLCTCDKVKVGACVHSFMGYYGCAVSADACDFESDFHSWKRVQEAGYDCRLCDTFDKSREVKKFGSIHMNGACKAGAAGVAGFGGLVGGVALTSLVGLIILYRRHKSGNDFSELVKGMDGIFKYGGKSSPMEEMYPENLHKISERDSIFSPDAPVLTPNRTEELKQQEPGEIRSVRIVRNRSPSFTDDDDDDDDLTPVDF